MPCSQVDQDDMIGDQASADRLAYFEAVYEGFKRAEGAAGGSAARFYTVGGHTVCLRFAGQALIPQLTPAVAHLETGPTEVPALTICIWDSVSTQTRMPLLVSSLIQLLSSNWWEQLDTRFEIKGYNDSRIRSSFHVGPNILSVLDAQRNLAVYWVNDAAQIPYFERGSPLKTILNWWTARQELQYVHAGAVGTSTGGVLLAGKGGVGKSTTALACVGSELSYASDDYCLVANTPAPYVYSLYNTVKLDGLEDLGRFPHLKSMVSNIDRVNEEKLMIYLHQHYPHEVTKGFPIRAVVVPHVTGQTETRLRPATSGAALRSLAPSTILQLPGTGQSTLQFMSLLVRRVPCFILDLGTDISRVPDVILDLLSEDCAQLLDDCSSLR